MSKCIALKEGYSQVAVLQGLLVTEAGMSFSELESEIEKHLNTKCQVLEEVKTKPDLSELGKEIEGTGGRNDVLIAIHDESVPTFAITRLSVDGKWLEDVLSNSKSLYPDYLSEYCK